MTLNTTIPEPLSEVSDPDGLTLEFWAVLERNGRISFIPGDEDAPSVFVEDSLP